MINEKYNKKMMEIKKVGGYVERLFIIENDMSLDVDEGLLDRYVLTLLTYCIDRINRVYIEGENKYNDCDEFGKISDIVTQDDECNENGGI